MIKSRMQTDGFGPADGQKYKSSLDCVRTVWRTEGIKAFYRGLIPSLMGISHVAVQFPLYEQLKIWAREHLNLFLAPMRGC